LSRNVGKKLQLLAAYYRRRAQFSWRRYFVKKKTIGTDRLSRNVGKKLQLLAAY